MNEKTYTYDGRRYAIQVTLTGWFCVAITIACLVLASPLFSFAPVVMAIFAVVAAYTVFGTFVSHSYPRVVTLSDEQIGFESFGRTDVFPIAQIRELSVRELQDDGAYVRINGGGVLRGRYWVRGQWMGDGHELVTRLSDLECQIHPDGLKARARKAAASPQPAKPRRSRKK